MPRVIVTRDPAGAGSLNSVSIWPPGVTPSLKGRSSMWVANVYGEGPPIGMSYAQWLWASDGVELELGESKPVDLAIAVAEPKAREETPA